MANAPHPGSSDRSQLLLDFAIRFYTALRTIRLYPATNPQVQRSNEAVVQTFQALLEGTNGDAVSLAVSDQKLLVCGEHLAGKEQLRPQVQGLVTLFSRANIHSLSFRATFSLAECISLTQALSTLLGEKEPTITVAALLDQTGIVSVSADAKRYVAIHEGEQVVREELLGPGLHISDEELTSYVLGRQGDGTIVPGVSRELVQELINRLPGSGHADQHPEAMTAAVIDFLQQLSREHDGAKRSLDIVQGAETLSALDPSLLAQLIARLPETVEADAVLGSALDQLAPEHLNALISRLVAQQPMTAAKETTGTGRNESMPAPLQRLLELEPARQQEITQTIAHNIDAKSLLGAAHLSDQISASLTMRLQQPAWSAPVLVAATRQVLEQTQDDGGLDFSRFEQMLDRYDTLLDREKQLQVANQAGPQIAAFEDQELGLFLVKKFKNLFGEQLYHQVISQLSPDRLERLTAHCRDLAEGRAPKPSDVDEKEIEEAYLRLQETVRGEKMRAIVELHREQKKQQETDFKCTIAGGLERLLHGDCTELENSRFIAAIPQTVRNLFVENKAEMGDNLLMQLALALQHQQPAIRANAFRALAATAEQLAHIGQWERFAKLLPALQQGLQSPECDAQSSQKTLRGIGALTGHSLAQEQYLSALDTAHFLQTLTTGDHHPPHIREQAQEMLQSICTKPVLEQLLDRYLHSETHQETAGKLLVELGTESAQFQLQHLFDSESRFERKRLLSLIKQTGNPAISLLLEQLHQDAPWFVLRNSIRLLGELGNPALFTRVRPFIQHSDPRVQQEVMSTAVNIGGDQLKDFLLHALENVDDSLKIRIINHVAAAHDERFVRPLTDLLESTKPFLGKNKSDLQVSICATLAAIGSKRASTSLSRVAQSKNVLGLAGYSDEVRLAAEQALEQIRVANSGTRKSAFQNAVPEMTVPPGQPVSGTLERSSPSGQEILSLDEIVASKELIEPEQPGPIGEEDLEIWAELTDRLGTEEFQTIYRAFTERRCTPEETIVRQGDKNDSLFFINQGSLKVSHMVGPRELFITSLNRGQLAGENFFTPSLWTVTLTSLTPSRLYILPQSALAQWQQRFPGLRARLYEYYRAYNNIGSMLKKKGLDRRQDQRFTLSRKIQVQPISHLDAPIGRGFRAETADISLGGMSFLVRIAHREHARLLLGRRMQIVLPVGGKISHLQFKGLIIGVQPFQQRSNDFSVHFKFDLPLDRQELQAILG